MNKYIFNFNLFEQSKSLKTYYTIGWYDKKTINASKKGRLTKIGKFPPKNEKDTLLDRDKNYTGGIVFKNLEDIKTYCEKTNVKNFNFDVFEILDCSDKDIYKGKDNFYYLLYDKKIKWFKKY